MARINIPEGAGHEIERVWRINPKLGGAVIGLRHAVYNNNHLPLRIREGVRYLIADCNKCPICLSARQLDENKAELSDGFYRAILEDRESDEFNERERLALEYTYRFCYDHFSITDELFERLRAAFTDIELFDLCVTVARHLGFGRFTQVLQLDFACELHVSPSDLEGAVAP
jgi:alkylhydroperoxidase family enzyme